ncbi:MAG: type II toxin-antitoxin system tRNA(fMet)-specific endonuclease VapC [bacterium]
MLEYMLDTDISIHILNERPEKLKQAFNRIAERICISTITLAELHYGAEKSSRRADNLRAVEHFIARLDVRPLTAKAAAHYGQIRAELEKVGKPVGVHDMLIGAHARSESLTLVTGNRREFDRITGLRVENWL